MSRISKKVAVGRETQDCLGIGSTASDGTQVSLQPCGISAATVWVWLSTEEYSAITNGTDTLTSDPYVLTASSATGTLTMERRALSAYHTVPDTNQMWADRYGDFG
jgi:hypothetical protein